MQGEVQGFQAIAHTDTVSVRHVGCVFRLEASNSVPSKYQPLSNTRAMAASISDFSSR